VSGESTTVVNVGTGTGLVYRDMTGAQINLKSIKQGTGITVTNNADDITVTCTITQGPTGSGTINYIPKWTAATVLGDSPAIVDGNNIFLATTYRLNIGNTIVHPAFSLYYAGGTTFMGGETGSNAPLWIGAPISGNPQATIILDGSATPALVKINPNNYDADCVIGGVNLTDVARVDGSDDAFQIRGRFAMQGIIDNAGSAYVGGAVGAPTSIDLSTVSKTGNVVRIAPASEANRYYDLINAKNWQIVNVINEGLFNAFIVVKTSITSVYFCIPASQGYGAKGANFASLQWDPNAANSFGGWVQSSVQLQPVLVALTDAATIVVDASYGNALMTVTLGGNRQLGNPGFPIRGGQKILFRITQDGTGGRTLSYDTLYRFSTDLPSPTLSTGIGKIDYLGFIYHSDDNRWDFIGKVFGF